MGIIIGLILGSILTFLFYLIYIDHKSYEINSPKILDEVLESDIKNFTFIKRYNDIAEIEYSNVGIILYLFLDKKEIAFLNKSDSKVLIAISDFNKVKMDYIYNKLSRSFKNDIFNNIFKLNGITLSNNLIKNVTDESGDSVVDTYESEVTLDEILDKISEFGISSLTKNELTILKRSEN